MENSEQIYLREAAVGLESVGRFWDQWYQQVFVFKSNNSLIQLSWVFLPIWFFFGTTFRCVKWPSTCRQITSFLLVLTQFVYWNMESLIPRNPPNWRLNDTLKMSFICPFSSYACKVHFSFPNGNHKAPPKLTPLSFHNLATSPGRVPNYVGFSRLLLHCFLFKKFP